MDESTTSNEWQWWRISFSVDDGKTQQAAKAGSQSKFVTPSHADIIGYTAKRVREIEVLRAARDESTNVLLVYANDKAVGFQDGPTPPALEVFHPQNRNLEFLTNLGPRRHSSKPTMPRSRQSSRASSYQTHRPLTSPVTRSHPATRASKLTKRRRSRRSHPRLMFLIMRLARLTMSRRLAAGSQRCRRWGISDFYDHNVYYQELFVRVNRSVQLI